MSFASHRFTVVDAATDLQALGGCQQVAARTVTCDEPTDSTARKAVVYLGGGRDDFVLGPVEQGSGFSADVFGGLSGNRIDVRQELGSAQIHGGPGNDTLIGGSGDDLFYPGNGVNTIEGGAGNNTVTYADAAGPVHASLSAGTGSAPGRTDTFKDIQNLYGSAFDDVLIGDNGPNLLTGSSGNNVLIGRGGNDELSSPGTSASPPGGTKAIPVGPSHSILIGGSGSTEFWGGCGDTLIGGTGISTFDVLGIPYCARVAKPLGPQLLRVYCGSRKDTVLDPYLFVLLSGCGTLRVLSADGDLIGHPPAPVLRRHWGASWYVPCPIGPCNSKLTLSIRVPGHTVLLGQNSFHSRGEPCWV